jgi:hypothetical protein
MGRWARILKAAEIDALNAAPAAVYGQGSVAAKGRCR